MQAEAQPPRFTDTNSQISRIALYVLLTLLAIAILFPFYWMVATSLKTNPEAFYYPPDFYPPQPTLEHYQIIMTRDDINVPRWGWNSLVIAVATTAVTLFVTSLAAYGFARLDFPFKNLIFIVVIFTLMIPSQIYMIPNYLLVRDLGWLDTYHAVIWPAAPNVFGLFLLRQFFSTFPRELEEAATVDGAGRIRIYWQLMIPVNRNALIALGIFVFLHSWNDLFWPLIVLSRVENRTLPVGLAVLAGAYGAGDSFSEPALIMAASSMSSIPVLIVYVIFQRRITQSFMLTGMGGR